MRTTLNLDDALLAQLKALAAQRRTTLSQVVEDAVRHSLTLHQQAASQPPLSLPVYGGSGLLPGVHLDSFADLLDVMGEGGDT